MLLGVQMLFVFRDHGGVSVSSFLVSLRWHSVVGSVVSVYLFGVVHEDLYLFVMGQR